MKSEGYRTNSARFDRLPGNILRECAVYKIYIPPEIIDHYLPDDILAYRAQTQKNFMRRLFFFSKQAAASTRSELDDYIDQLPYSVSFNYFLQKLARERDRRVYYNFIVMNDYMIFIRVPHYLDKSYSPLCKHITISSRAKYVRYAGEIWPDGHNHFIVNNSSGAYRPPDELIQQAVQLFKYLSPNTYFQGISFRLTATPSMAQHY